MEGDSPFFWTDHNAAAAGIAFAGVEDDGWLALLGVGDHDVGLADVDATVTADTDFLVEL